MASIKPQPKAGEDEVLPLASYRKHAAEISILLGDFFLRYLARVYREFKGDLAAIIVLGEIGRHNVNHCWTGQGGACVVDVEKASDPGIWQQLRPCNAFSLSLATGIPRETVRRKISMLVARGWLRRNSRGEVFITPAAADHFHAEFDPAVLRDFLQIARRVESLLSAGPAPRKPSAAQPRRQVAASPTGNPNKVFL